VTVTQVARGRVVLRNGPQLEYLDIGVAPPPQSATAPAPAAAPLPEGDENSREIEGAAESISCDGEMNSCTVDRAFVEKLLANPAQLAKQARIVPAVRDGETKGYKFYGIRPGSLPKLLGIKNGDLLTSVNGHQLESLDQAMDLYNKLRRASHLSVTIERKGQMVQKEIDIK
jgi:type II secretion system protein C